jgi:peptidoglycan DL-endopeptidase CwlO
LTWHNQHDKIKIGVDQNKKPFKKMSLSQKFSLHGMSRLRALALVVAASGLISGSVLVHADQFQDQINSLQSQNSTNQALVNSLQAQATSYQNAISTLQQQISAIQDAIQTNQAKQVQLQQQIATDQQQIAQKKSALGADIKAMYIDGSMTTIEELATSKNLSDYVDKEQYRTDVQNQLDDQIQQIAQLEAQVQQQKDQLDIVVKTESQQNDQLVSDQTQQQQLLAYNQGQQSAYNQQIASNQAQIATLRAEQIAANRKLVSTGTVDFSGTCGGSYPASAAGPDGNWGCNYGLDNTIDNWGMYNRECVSYTAWMVYETYGYMPYWGGEGNANEWPGDAQAAGIPTGSTPKVNSVAIYMGGSTDPYGHAMWVKSINSDGTITVDQYNLYYDGNFYETTIPSSGLTYIYFGG